MDNMGISTEPTFLDVELPQTLLESPSTSTFLPEEEASICPLLSNSGLSNPLISHPLSPNCMGNDIISSNLSNTDCKAETSSSGSSTGIAMDAPDSTTTNLFNNVNYQHLQNNNINADEESRSHCLKGIGNNGKDTPSFVSWNWPLIRKLTFFVFLSTILAMCSIVIARIATMPKACNPTTAWYRGKVFYEILPMSFHDSDNDGIGDFSGIINRIDYLATLGISAVRLNSIFLSDDYPDSNGTSIKTINPALGNPSHLMNLASSLKAHNISLVLDLPLQQVITNNQNQENNIHDIVAGALKYWVNHGVDGFYLKGLTLLADDLTLPKYFASWKSILGADRILMVEESLIMGKLKSVSQLSKYIDLVDVHINVTSGTKKMHERIENILSLIPPSENGAWVHWTINCVKSPQDSNLIVAATIMQLMLPGTPNIMYGDEINGGQYNGHSFTDHPNHLIPVDWSNFGSTHHSTNHSALWRPNISLNNLDNLQIVHEMIALRKNSPSIYTNVKCKSISNSPNFQINHSDEDILIIVRNYPRRNSFVSITNVGGKKITFDLSSKFYSGTRMLTIENTKIYFKNFSIGPRETIVVKLDK